MDLRIALFTFYYPPDLSAGSFRALSLVESLSRKLTTNDQIHVITTYPNRYSNFHTQIEEIEEIEAKGIITIHRIYTPKHNGSMLSQIYSYFFYAISAHKLNRKLNPDFLLVTTGRLMSSILTLIFARMIRRDFFVDMRDIFSESISDLLAKKSKLLGWITKYSFLAIEKQIFKNALSVNMVSEGFSEYFQENGIDTSKWTFFTNGVDNEFIGLASSERASKKKIKTILYAGNIGSGQGLETVIPGAAKLLGSDYQFLIIGDGTSKSLLKNKIKIEGVDNIKILRPIKRLDLIDYYLNADIFFLHLNDFPAFRRVIPSKIFEYAAFGKPIVAGLNGYSEQFIREHIPYAILFDSCDSLAASSSIKKASNLAISKTVTNNFVNMFSRISIMDKMADHLIDVMKKN